MAHGLMAEARPVTLPPELGPGASYRLVFVTSGTRDASSAGIADYNAFVAAAAAAVSELNALGATWKVIGTTAAVDARDNIGGSDGTPIYNLAGQIVAPNGTTDLWGTASVASALSNPIAYDEHGTYRDTHVWTGTGGDGRQWSNDSALGFTGSWVLCCHSTATTAPLGNNRVVNDGAVWNANIGTSPGLGPGSNQGSFYAISAVLTVPTGPSTACNMLSFGWDGQSTDVDGPGFTYYVPRGTSLADLAPTITASAGATVSPPPGSPQDFTSPVEYTVTAEDGITTKTYRVTVLHDPLILTIEPIEDDLAFSWNGQDGMAYDLLSTDDIGTPLSEWDLAAGGILPNLAGTTSETIPRPAAARQFFMVEERSDTELAWDASSGALTLSYGGAVQLDGTITAEDAGGQPVPGYTFALDATETTVGGGIQQTLRIDPDNPQAGVDLVFRGTFTASAQAIPVETSGAAQSRFPCVRNSVGLSRSLRNNAVYDRYHDWALIGPNNGSTVIHPASAGPDSITFTWESRGGSLELVARPRYYRDHLGLEHFDPATYHPSKESITGYCTWWAYKYDFTQQTLDALVDVFGRKHLPEFGYNFIQLDDTYQIGNGSCPQNWLTWNAKFPGGPAYAVNKIQSIGMKGGIWVHRVHRPSDPNVIQIGIDHPDWFVQNLDGSLYLNNGFYCLNTHNEEALENMARVTYRALRQQGWDYVKIDGAGDLLNAYNGAPWFFQQIGRTTAETFRRWDIAAREELGPDIYILSCWGVGPGREVIGLVDGCRLDGDGFYTPPLCNYNHLNGIVWRNDPDHCDILAAPLQPKTDMNVFATGQAMADTVERPCITSLAGAVLMVSDPVAAYEDDGNLEGMKRSSPVLFTTPGQLYNVGGGTQPWWLLEIDRPFDHWTVLGHFNFRQQAGGNWPRPGTPATAVAFADLGLDPAREYLVFEFWTQTFLGKFSGSFTAPAMDTDTAVQIFAIREARDHPWIVSTTRHITQGGVSLSDVQWNPATNTLSGESAVIVDDPYTITVHLPAGYQLQSTTAGGETVTLANQAETATMSFTPSATGSVPWQMTFTR